MFAGMRMNLRKLNDWRIKNGFCSDRKFLHYLCQRTGMTPRQMLWLYENEEWKLWRLLKR